MHSVILCNESRSLLVLRIVFFCWWAADCCATLKTWETRKCPGVWSTWITRAMVLFFACSNHISSILCRQRLIWVTFYCKSHLLSCSSMFLAPKISFYGPIYLISFCTWHNLRMSQWCRPMIPLAAVSIATWRCQRVTAGLFLDIQNIAELLKV